MFEFLKRLGHSGRRRFHGHRHGRAETGPQREISLHSGALQPETSVSQCPLCEKHCPLNNPGCRKGAAFALQQFSPRKEHGHEQ
jgi:hypothetical protein